MWQRNYRKAWDMNEFKESSKSFTARAMTDVSALAELLQAYQTKKEDDFLGRKYTLDQIDDRLTKIVESINAARFTHIQEKREWKKELKDCSESSTESQQTEG